MKIIFPISQSYISILKVSRYLGGVRSAEITERYIVANLDHWAKHGFGLWALSTKGSEFVGRAGIRHIVVETNEVEIVYALKRACWGQGFASEIVAALVKRWMARLPFPSLIGLASVGNGASRHVLEKSGFVFERGAVYRGEEVVIYRRTR